MGSYFWVLKFLFQNQGVPVYIVQNAMDDHSLTLFSPKSIKYYRNQISTTVKSTYTLDILFFLSNHNINKSLCGLCFWASDPLLDRFY